jgi:hypothetical protein
MRIARPASIRITCRRATTANDLAKVTTRSGRTVKLSDKRKQQLEAKDSQLPAAKKAKNNN